MNIIVIKLNASVTLIGECSSANNVYMNRTFQQQVPLFSVCVSIDVIAKFMIVAHAIADQSEQIKISR